MEFNSGLYLFKMFLFFLYMEFRREETGLRKTPCWNLFRKKDGKWILNEFLLNFSNQRRGSQRDAREEVPTSLLHYALKAYHFGSPLSIRSLNLQRNNESSILAMRATAPTDDRRIAIAVDCTSQYAGLASSRNIDPVIC